MSRKWYTIEPSEKLDEKLEKLKRIYPGEIKRYLYSRAISRGCDELIKEAEKKS